MSQLVLPGFLAIAAVVLHFALTSRYKVSNTHQWAAAILPSVDVFVLIMCVIAPFKASDSRAVGVLWLIFLVLIAVTIWLHKSGIDSMS
jgi:hypothetical protein